MDTLSIIGRDRELFVDDISKHERALREIISSSRFLVLGGAGTIGQATTKEIFKRNPLKLHVVDISENNLVELVRDIRSSFGYISGDFKTYALDIGSDIYNRFIENDGDYDYVLNLSALKHVRSEKDPYTLMRMIDVNVFNTDKTIRQSIIKKSKKYFCVSTDKAANPVNMMGASKRIMEMFLMRRSLDISISTARFANVAFSDGSLLYGFNQRIQKRQPIVAPNDVRRYFVVSKEAGELCLMSAIFGENRDIFFPKLSQKLNLVSFSDIAVKFLAQLGYEPHICEDESEARGLVQVLAKKNKWPCLFTPSDTTGEKDFEEFFTENETIDFDRFNNLGVIKNELNIDEGKLLSFETTIHRMKSQGRWEKSEIVDLFNEMIPNFNHLETGKYLDSKM
ncbi:Polysaccharide biosynthesis protein [Arachidicoccus rhizosphaerae]|uniref:Polysaccharide biosynthesis protein n=1 Tax=Arachidicoccus rhizosphaerae TaxID=551991 RepID=A0A1H4CPD2_9BACT|nr:UDP-N-acetylglucosamine 4,6-dehydratase [Arachidicoccus rhizosphaerae]SEA62266.1 Polysaccharide biosynthesis protein [Arachidicoccus rhizosphaerae]